MKLILTTLLFFTSLSLQAQLKLSEIMAGDDFIGHQPSNIVWSPDNKTVYFRWNHEQRYVAPYYKVNIDTKQLTKQLTKLSNAETLGLPIDGCTGDKSNQHTYFQKDGNLYRYSEKGSDLLFQQNTHYRITNVFEDNKVIIKNGNNLYLYAPDYGKYIQLIDFKKGNKPAEPAKPNFLERQQEELFEIIRENKAKANARDEFNKATAEKGIPKFYLGHKSLGWIKITPDLKYIVFRLDKYDDHKNTHIENHITENGYTKSTPARSKVGSKNAEHELYVMNLEDESFNKIDISTLPNIYDKPKYILDYHKNDDNFNPKYENTRDVIYTDCWISDEENNCVVEIKSYDNKSRWIVSLDLNNKGQMKLEEQQNDDAWIGGPGISGWNMVSGNIGFLNDFKTFYYQSETSGYSHIYLRNIKTSTTTQLTSGKFEIHEAILSNDGTKFYISANKTHPGNREFYHFNIDKKEWIPIHTKDGNHEVTISPDEKNIAVKYSYTNKPWELYIGANKPKSDLVQITASTTPNFKNYQWRAPEVITFKTENGQDVYARLYRPDPKVKNGAAVQFVHGAGYLQNAHNWWSGYHREYMFNNHLCDLGYTVIDIDYRASKGYGRDFRTAIYRHMGGADLEDQFLGRQYLIDNEGIDPDKVGIYGGSYGGFITIMALLTEPHKFKCGAAVRSVTDWAHYNHAYTSNILNTPETDDVAFKRSSPIYFADGLKNKLLILHGMVDDNVQFQDVVRLNQRFIELGKKNFDMALYPIEPHGFKETSSWVDEYTRILNLFNEELLNK